MVVYLTKSDASEGFNQVIDFLNGSYIKYALIVNPNIYVSCIKQFWNTVAIKQVNDVTRKGFSGVKTPLFEGMLVGQEIEEVGDAEEHVKDAQPQPQPQPQATDFPMSLLQEALDACAALTRRVEKLEYDKVAQALEITKLKRRVKKLERGNRVRVLKLRRLKRVGTSQRIDTSDDTVIDDKSNQGRIIDEMDKDDAIFLMDHKKEDKKDEEAKEDKPAKVQEVVDVVTTTKLITEVVTTASKTVTAASAIISVIELQVPAATITTAPTRVVAAPRKEIMVEEPKPLKKKQQIEMNEEYARKLHAEINKYIDWDVAIDHVKLKAKKDPAIKEQIEEEESKALQSINETPTQKAAKRRKLNEEVEDLKRHLEILMKMMMSILKPLHLQEREELEALWILVKERFSTSKPKNFSNDFLLTTLGAMFEKPDAQDQVWKNQRTMYGQAKVKSWKILESCGVHIITFTTTQLILLIEKRYPLSRFTLDQMLNNVRIQVKEESEVSLELLRFTRQQHQEGQLE
nr:hypothetical protein [Tanacetum cinerariifolium]